MLKLNRHELRHWVGSMGAAVAGRMVEHADRELLNRRGVMAWSAHEVYPSELGGCGQLATPKNREVIPCSQLYNTGRKAIAQSSPGGVGCLKAGGPDRRCDPILRRSLLAHPEALIESGDNRYYLASQPSPGLNAVQHFGRGGGGFLYQFLVIASADDNRTGLAQRNGCAGRFLQHAILLRWTHGFLDSCFDADAGKAKAPLPGNRQRGFEMIGSRVTRVGGHLSVPWWPAQVHHGRDTDMRGNQGGDPALAQVVVVTLEQVLGVDPPEMEGEGRSRAILLQDRYGDRFGCTSSAKAV